MKKITWHNFPQLVGLAGFEPVAFTRNHITVQFLRVSLAFTAPEIRHPTERSSNQLFNSGARRHAWLDYSPT